MADLGAEKQGIFSRRRAREAALQALYHCDTIGDCSEQQIQFFFTHFFPESVAQDAIGLFENYQYAVSLVKGVIREIAAVDGAISGASTHWSVSRMSRVDRNIIRVAVFEIMSIPEIPVNVSINEAIEIAKRFGAPESAHFVNGVLDQVARRLLGAQEGAPLKKVASSSR